MIIAFDEEAQEMLSDSIPGGDPVTAMSGSAPPGWTSEDWSEGGFDGTLVTANFADLNGLQNLVDTTMSGEDGMFESFSIIESAGGYRIDGILSGDSLEQGMEGGDLFAGAAEEMVGEFFDAAITMKLPGEVTSHNADEVRGDGTLVWNVGVTDGGRAIRAESQPGGSLPIIPIAAAAVVLLIGVVGFLTVRRNRPPAHPITQLEYTDDGKPQLVAVQADPYA